MPCRPLYTYFLIMAQLIREGTVPGFGSGLQSAGLEARLLEGFTIRPEELLQIPVQGILLAKKVFKCQESRLVRSVFLLDSFPCPPLAEGSFRLYRRQLSRRAIVKSSAANTGLWLTRTTFQQES